MKFVISSISSHSAKANLVTYELINTSTILDGCKVTGYVPKSVQLVEGVEQEVPYFVADGIFGFNRSRNIKFLEKQLQAKAPKGKKREWRAQAADLLTEVSKLNVEVEEEPTGTFIGTIGEKITFVISSVQLVHTRDWVSQSGWRHNGHGWERPSGTRQMWQISDVDGNVFMFASSGVKINNTLNEVLPNTVMEAVVDEHNVYHGTRQTWLRNLKFNPSLFELLGKV